MHFWTFLDIFGHFWAFLGDFWKKIILWHSVYCSGVVRHRGHVSNTFSGGNNCQKDIFHHRKALKTCSPRRTMSEYYMSCEACDLCILVHFWTFLDIFGHFWVIFGKTHFLA
jgi:hypothetical protein